MRMINELKIVNNMKTAKQWKRVPFDIELAKKIQAGEIEGAIKYSECDGYAYDAEIIKFDVIADKSRAKPNSTLFRTIVAIIDFNDYQGVRTFNTDGYGFNHSGDDTKLFIELPEEAPKRKGELTLGKCKEGDEVWIYSNYEYGPEYVKVKVGKFSLDTSSGHRRNVIFDNGFTCQELTSSICWYKNPITFHTDIPNGHAEIHGDTISFVNEEIPDITTSEGFHRTFNKHEFKVGDKVSIGDYNEEDVEIYTIVKIRENLAFLNDGSTMPLDGLTLRESKHEFKPFDKVLVRNGDNKWKPAFYGYMIDNRYSYVTSGDFKYEQCIPYEGNEHLVGTTDKPKEE